MCSEYFNFKKLGVVSAHFIYLLRLVLTKSSIKEHKHFGFCNELGLRCFLRGTEFLYII
jgi:hypothetical protein